MTKIFYPLLALIASATNHELAKYVEYLKEENKILRARIPGQIHTKPEERERLLKFGKVIGRAIEELITIVSPATFYRWIRDDGEGKPKTKNPKGGQGAGNDIGNVGTGSGNAAAADSASGGEYYDSGSLADGGFWEYYDDGMYWWYAEYNSDNEIMFYDSGDYTISGMAAAMYLGQTTADDAASVGTPDADEYQYVNFIGEGEGSAEEGESGTEETELSLEQKRHLQNLQRAAKKMLREFDPGKSPTKTSRLWSTRVKRNNLRKTGRRSL